jgi:hypothetical protein
VVDGYGSRRLGSDADFRTGKLDSASTAEPVCRCVGEVAGVAMTDESGPTLATETPVGGVVALTAHAVHTRISSQVAFGVTGILRAKIV